MTNYQKYKKLKEKIKKEVPGITGYMPHTKTGWLAGEPTGYVVEYCRAITLEDVLSVIPKESYLAISVNGEFLPNPKMIVKNKGEFVKWQLGKHLHEQPSEVIDFLYQVIFENKSNL